MLDIVGIANARFAFLNQVWIGSHDERSFVLKQLNAEKREDERDGKIRKSKVRSVNPTIYIADLPIVGSKTRGARYSESATDIDVCADSL
jgi:hypothetical protein